MDQWSEDIDWQHTWSVLSLSRLKFFFSARLPFFFQPDLHFFFYPNFKLSTCVCSHDICLVLFSFMNIYFANLDSYFFYCIRCILQVSTYVLCFRHVLTIGIILSAMECHNSKGTQREYSSKLLKHSIVKHIL